MLLFYVVKVPIADGLTILLQGISTLDMWQVWQKSAILGGVLEQTDLVYKHNLPLEPLYCFQNAFPGFCDNPDDQAAVDFGYELADKYGSNGLNDQQLRQELEINELGRFQAPPSDSPFHILHTPNATITGQTNLINRSTS